MIFIIEQGGKAVGFMSIEKDQTLLMLDKSIYQPVTATIIKKNVRPADGSEEVAAGLAAYVQEHLKEGFGPAGFGVGIDLEANERNQQPSAGSGGRRFCLDERLGNS